jgi:branched-chain amino acid transport system permease protein
MTIRVLAALVLFALLAAAPALVTPFEVRVLSLFCFWGALSLAWSILGGFAGYWSFGRTVFIGVGAFVPGLIVARLLDGGGAELMPLMVLAGGLVSAAFAAIIAWPLLRLRGIYFAIAMLGVAQVTGELSAAIEWIGGGIGLSLLDPAPAALAPEAFYHYIFVGLLALTVGVAAWVRGARLGQGLLAIREDEDTARMLAVPTEGYKIAALVLSAFLTGLLGATYGFSLGYITTDSVFRTDFSLNMIVHALLGGIGTVVGPLLGAAVMVVLTQVLLGEMLNLHLFVTGALVVAMVLLAPQGLLGLWRRRASREGGKPRR